jgi:hypothetical protein
MRKILLFATFLFYYTIANAQNFTGQWKGSFADRSTSYAGWGGDKCEYVLELECKGSKVSGYSYTYFNEAGIKYYTICKLKGKVNAKARFIEVVEIERTKTNVPYNIRNCFQIHRLTFFKEGNQETLEGNWVPAPDQAGGCGYGTTLLSRRLLKDITGQYNKSQTRGTNTATAQTPNTKTATAKTDNNKKTLPTPPVAKNIPPKNNSGNNTTAKNNPSIKIEPHINTIPTPPVAKKDLPQKIQSNKGFEQRNNSVVKTIEIEKENFRVDLYDNGDIDGDTVSLFYNGALLMAKKRLSDRAISFDLNFDNNKPINELTMYAENLGEIPPNTALMIVTDGSKRYEVRITSDLQKSGVIRFVHKQNE